MTALYIPSHTTLQLKYLVFLPLLTKEQIPVNVTPVHIARFKTFRRRNSLIALKKQGITTHQMSLVFDSSLCECTGNEQNNNCSLYSHEDLGTVLFPWAAIKLTCATCLYKKPEFKIQLAMNLNLLLDIFLLSVNCLTIISELKTFQYTPC